jgi:hypothetical protein
MGLWYERGGGCAMRDIYIDIVCVCELGICELDMCECVSERVSESVCALCICVRMRWKR